MRENGFATEIRPAEAFRIYLAAQEKKWQDVIRGAGCEGLGRSTSDPGPRALPVALAILVNPLGPARRGLHLPANLGMTFAMYARL